MEIKIHILHADDDPEDRWLLKDGLQEIDPNIQLTQFADGVEIMDFLNRLTPGSTPVHAIICDMQMPLMGGASLLNNIKKSAQWKHLPVIIFSTSSSRFDHNLSIENGAAAFFSKPSTYAENLAILNEIIMFFKKGELVKG
jgi:CheY-like chemotaxis protein